MLLVSVSLILGAAVSGLVTYLFMKSRASAHLGVLQERTRMISEQRDALQGDVSRVSLAQTALERRLAGSDAENRGLRERITELSQIKEGLQAGFEDMMRKVHENSHDRASKASHEKLTAVIDPFKDALAQFGQTVRDTYDKGSKETVTLRTQLEQFNEIQKNLRSQTENLTKALKGDSKIQGDWGEMVLESLLTSAGLREDHEYIVQGKGLGLKSETGSTRKPDVIVRLPQEKDVIVDSKVSLTAYERYFACDSEEERKIAATALVESIDSHIKDLAKKDYAALYGIQSPDYVLLFIPIDGAFLLASESSRDLYHRAIEKRVHLVSPSFLMPALKMIHHLWQRDKQSKNAVKIAEDAGRLYDKFVDFVSDIQMAQDAIAKAGYATDNAMKKLGTGNGNLIKRTEDLKRLGAKAKKQLQVTEDDQASNEPEPNRSLTVQLEDVGDLATEEVWKQS